jgi:hypothetical protein
MATTDIKAGCYCELWEKDPKVLEDQGVPRGYCGICGCGAPGHTRHYPGPVPVTSSWCDECYRRLPRIPLMMKLYNALVLLVLIGIGYGIWLLIRWLLA